ncbi:MAG: hypothetical protein FJX76_09490 [Armatimonadetes bacterium]|nr:hypothetical protein [Armatimonadota bacterium]
MLRELEGVRQRKGEPRRRWFTDNEHDLIVWFDPDESIRGFQFCYDRRRNEFAVTWMSTDGYTHEQVQHGAGGYDRLSVLVPSDLRMPGEIPDRFREVAQGIDLGLAEFVYYKLIDFERSSALR